MTSPDRIRTQTVECAGEGDVLQITYDRVKQLYFQIPKFGCYFLELTTRRLIENIAVLESQLASTACAGASPGESGRQQE